MTVESSSLYGTLARLTAEVCGARVGIVSLGDSRVWVDRRSSSADAPVDTADDAELPRRPEIWNATLHGTEVVEIAHPSPATGFYAGTRLIDASGTTIGTICALDPSARTLSERRRRALHLIGGRLMRLIEERSDASREDLETFGLLGDAFELVADPIAILRSEDPHEVPKFSYVNHAFTKLFGYAPESVLGKSVGMLDGPATDRKTIDDFIREVADRGVAIGRITFYTAAGEQRFVQLEDRGLDTTHRIVSFRDFTRERDAEAQLADTNDRLQSLMNSNSDAIFTLDRDGGCIDANPAAEALVGFSLEELRRDGLRGTPGGFFPTGEAFPNRLELGGPYPFAASYRHRGGRIVPVECTAIPMIVRGSIEGAYVLATDVTERRRLAELAARQSRRAQDLSAVAVATAGSDADQIDAALGLVLISFNMHNSYVAELIGDPPDRVRVSNRIGERIFDVGNVVNIADTRIGEMLALGDVYTIDDIEVGGEVDEAQYYARGWHAYICAPLHVGGKVYGAMGLASRTPAKFDDADRDFIRLAAALVSAAIERRIREEQLDRMAYVDSLTELPNRAQFNRDLAHALEGPDRPFALHFIDLDGFKPLNDRFGHGIGDLALREVGRRIAALLGPDESAARLGGDEFVVLQSGDPGRSGAATLGARIVERLCEPYELEGGTYALGASVGVAFFPEDGTAADTLMRGADAMLYRAKTAGRRRVEMTPGRLKG